MGPWRLALGCPAPRGRQGPLILGRALTVAALVISLAAASDAGAHPHVFVDHTITVIVGPDGLDGIQFAWTFDEMFSSMIALTFDTDKDKSFSPAEARTVEQKHFSNLKDFGYFLHLRVDDKAATIAGYRDFQVKLVNGQVVYAFTVPLKAGEGALEIAVDDPTYYSAFALNQRSPVQVQGAKNYRVDCQVARDGGSIAEVVKCTFKRQTR
jgi:ABC-type uncharacterized transport system substrate-binding protein